MYYNGNYHEHHEKSPFEKARDLLLQLNLEQQKGEKKNLDIITNLKWRLLDIPFKDVENAFNNIVDTQGWRSE